MSTLLLIRHASHDLLGKKLAGWMDGVGLNEQGRIEAARLGRRVASVPLEAVYTSPLPRSVETATPLASRARCPLRLLEAVGEIRCGDWTGKDFEELRQRPEWIAYNSCRSLNRIPAGDSMLEAQARAVGAVDRLREKHPQGHVAVVSHGDVIRLIIAHYIGLPLDMMLRFEISPASISVLRLEPHGALLTSLNEVERAREEAPVGGPAHASATEEAER